jgi:hypothetical protein
VRTTDRTPRVTRELLEQLGLGDYPKWALVRNLAARKLYEEGWSMRMIAMALVCSVSTVHRACSDRTPRAQ